MNHIIIFRQFYKSVFNIIITLCGSRKYPYSPHKRDWKFRGGGGGLKEPLKQCMKLNWNFQRGGGSLGKSLPWGGMDIFWNHALLKKVKTCFFFENKQNSFICKYLLVFTFIFVVFALTVNFLYSEQC